MDIAARPASHRYTLYSGVGHAKTIRLHRDVAARTKRIRRTGLPRITVDDCLTAHGTLPRPYRDIICSGAAIAFAPKDCLVL